MPRTTAPGIGFLVVCLSAGVAARAADEFAYFHENVMGTALELRVVADNEATARRAEGRILGEIDRLGRVFSNHDPSSEFRLWQAGVKAPVRVSAELFEVLAMSDRWRGLSGGAFDPRVHVLTQLWSESARLGRTLRDDERSAALAALRRPAWRLDPSRQTAERLSDEPLTLDAIAKGYIIEKACDAAMRAEPTIRGLLLNIGGDLRACGEAQRTLGLARPRGDSEATEPFAAIVVVDRAVATSGDSQRGFRIQGRWYSHIFDPRTGLPASGAVSATVIAPRSADADALATILNVLEPEDGLKLVRSIPGVECLIVSADGRVARSDGWHFFERPLPVVARPTAGVADARDENAEASWGDTHELVLNFEINRPEAEKGRYRRPYVAVWAEDKDGNVVRNLVLWVSQGGSGPFQWLPDLKRWFRADKLRKKTDPTEMLFTIARPTRPPGKYTVIWDGKDDHGKPLPPGQYNLSIDAAREHGTYQGIRKSLTLAATPFEEELPGNVEIRAASLSYRRKAATK